MPADTKPITIRSKHLSKEDLEECFDQRDDVIGIICKVWENGCSHPELCKTKCYDDDLVRERIYIDNGD